MRLFVAVLFLALTTSALSAQPKPSVSQTTVDFGTVVLLDSKTATFTIKNAGDTAFNFLGYGARTGPWTNEFKVVSGFRPVFEPDSSVVVTVSFTPKTITATHQHFDSLHLVFPSIGDSITILLKGTDHAPISDTVAIADTFISMPGRTIAIPQYLTAPIDGELDSIYSFTEIIEYDPNVLSTNRVDPGAVISGWSVNHYEAIRGLIVVRANAIGHALLGPGELLRMLFNVNDDAPVVSTASLIQDSLFFGSGFEPLMYSRPGRVFVIDSCVPRASNKTLGTTILPNSPNPFHDETVLTYQLATDAHASIRLFDARGNLVRILLDGTQESGLHQLRMNREGLAAGVYTCLFEAGGVRELRKLVAAP